MATDVFISYSRKNKDFAFQLVEALKASGHDVWIDVDAIPPSAEWWASIKRGIDEANAFVVILTPESLSSPVCTFEMDYAIKNNKRVVPLMRNDSVKSQTLGNIASVEPTGFLAEILGNADLLTIARDNWRVVEKLNWINLRDTDKFDDGLRNLLTVIEQDPKHVQEHTRLLVRALEWEANGRKAAYALRGEDLRDAEIWQAASIGKQPAPTELHLEYIRASQQVRKDEQSRNRALTQARFGIVLAIALFAVVGLLFFNLRNGEQSSANATLAAQATSISEALATSERRADEAQSLSWAAIAEQRDALGDPFSALSLSIQANRIANPSFFAQQVLANVGYNSRLRQRFVGPTNFISSVAFSPDGRTILSGSYDKSMILWDVQSGLPIRSFDGHSDAILSVAFSPDGRTILSGSYDKSMILWDVETGQIVRRFEGHFDAVSSVAFSPDGRMVLSGSYDGSMILWDVASGQQIYHFIKDTREVTSVAFSPDGQSIISGSRDKSVVLWSASSGQFIRSFDEDTEIESNIVFSPDGKTVVFATQDNNIALRDIETGKVINRFEGHTDTVSSVAFSPDGKTILSGSYDKSMILWDIETGKVINRFEGHTDTVSSVAFSPDGKNNTFRLIR